jgi:hypothetical protein
MGCKELCGRRKVRMATGMTGASRSGFFETRSIWLAEGEDEDDGLSGWKALCGQRKVRMAAGRGGEPSRKRKLEKSVWVEQHKFCMNFELIKSWWLILYDFLLCWWIFFMIFYVVSGG